MSTGKFALGILGGIAAGALLGVLFAPEEGKKTRKKIAEKGNDLAGEIKAKFDNLYKNITNHQDELLQDAKNLSAKRK
ncbi:YtxH domain-containing protein [Flavobacterium aestuarii]|uniref:YtxH domain-containing protein n=1 Tax=Flavobacterium aestuarii TaxID=3149227 RepID=UPI0032B49A49